MQTRSNVPTLEGLQAENAELRARLEEVEETLRSIHEGEVDAIIVSGSHGDRVFSLTETENLHRQMVETMNEAGLAISPDGLLLYCNERAATLLKRPRDDLLGQQLDTFVAPQDAGRLRDLLAASAQGTADDRVLFFAGDEAAVPLHLWASRLQRPEGPLICLLGTDLSRLEAERALVAQLQEQQQALRASRAEALDLMSQTEAARKSAARAAEQLREADRRKDAFLAALAHELRNPLAPIRNAFETLRLISAGEPQVLAALAIIDRQFSHLVRLLDDLLDVSRITRGKIDLRKEPVELSAVISTAVETVQPLIEAAGQRLTIKSASRPIWIEADPVRLGQVFANLLNNAAKYTGSGGEIRITVEPRDDGVQVAVCDTGVGIREELLPHVFELFRRDSSDQMRDKGGLGIGLSLVKRLTELHGGRVEASSAGPGHGSEFRVFLPLMASPPKEVLDTRTSRVRPLSGLPSACRILVVDDNRDAADSLGSLLVRQGGQVEIAFDGASALECFDAWHPHLIILDIGMPGMDGHEVARRIRARTGLPQPTLIAMSGLGQEADRQRSLKAGFDHHLVKPVPLDVLYSLLLEGWGSRESGGGISGLARAAATEQDGRGLSPRRLRVSPEDRASGLSAAATEVFTGEHATPEPEQERLDRVPVAGDDDAALTAQIDRLRLLSSSLLHDLAQPLNTIACYAVAARNLAAKSAGDAAPVCNALRGIDQQILRAGAVLDRLRALFDDLEAADSDRSRRGGEGPQ